MWLPGTRCVTLVRKKLCEALRITLRCFSVRRYNRNICIYWVLSQADVMVAVRSSRKSIVAIREPAEVALVERGINLPGLTCLHAKP